MFMKVKFDSGGSVRQIGKAGTTFVHGFYYLFGTYVLCYSLNTGYTINVSVEQ